MVYFIVLFLLFVLTLRYDILGKKKYRDEWYFVILIILIVIAGLRFRLGSDTINYLNNFYHNTPVLWDLSIDSFLMSGNPPLWILLNSVVKTFGGKFYVVQFFQAIIVNALFFKYFKKHSLYPFACVILFYLWRYHYYNMVVMKAAIALSILIFANDYFLEKKYKKGLFLVLLATGFHQSSILLLITPFLTFLRFNVLGIAILGIAYVVGAVLQSHLGDFFEMLEFAEGVSDKLDSYANSDKFLTSYSTIGYYIVNVIPIIIYPILYLVYLKRKNLSSPILKLEPFIIIGLIFQVLQINIHIFYRFVSIYSAYFILFNVQFFMDYSKQSVKLNKSLAFVRTFVFILPLIFSCYVFRSFTNVTFYPYSSVIERSIDKAREKLYAETNPPLNMEEY